MALKSLFEKLDDAPEPLREHLVQKDGKFVLDVEGYVSKETLNEFRTTNRTLKNELDQLKETHQTIQGQLADVQTKYKDIDPDEYHSLKAAPTDLQKQIAEVEKRLQKQFDDRVAEEQRGREAAERQLQIERIKSEVARVAPKMGVRDTAIGDVQGHAVETFAIIEDKLLPMQTSIVNGKPLREPRYSDRSPSKLMEVDEWIATLVPSHPHYFETSGGGGAPGGLGGRSVNGRHVIAASDNRSFLNNVEKIAKGEVEVDINA